MPGRHRDVFISHAWEDKDAVARPLAEALTARQISVWFDEYELRPGDSLRRRIDDGLAHATLGVVVLSRQFFRKEWSRRELDGLTARRVAGEPNVIVPVWHGLTVDDVRAFSPPLADLVATDASRGIDYVADQVERLLDRVEIPPALARALSGEILSPPPGSVLPMPFVAEGEIGGVWDRAHAWLAVRIDGVAGLFPKAPEIVRSPWSVDVYEPAKRFSLALVAVTAPDHRKIEEWFERGGETGSFPALTLRSGTELHCVKNLRGHVESRSGSG